MTSVLIPLDKLYEPMYNVYTLCIEIDFELYYVAEAQRIQPRFNKQENVWMEEK